MKAIQTRYHGPTDTKGSRISAHAEGAPRRYYTISNLPQTGNVEDLHHDAAVKLAYELMWVGENWTLVSGALPDGSHCHVFVKKEGR